MSFDQDPNEQANISGADLAMLVDELASCRDKLAKENDASLKLMAQLTAEREVSDKLERALKDVVENDPFKQSSAGIIARAALAEVAAIRNQPAVKTYCGGKPNYATKDKA